MEGRRLFVRNLTEGSFKFGIPFEVLNNEICVSERGLFVVYHG